MAKKKEAALTPEERLQAALVPDWEQPYKVPKNWCWTKLSSVCVIENGYAFKSKKFGDSSGTPVIRISNIQDNQISLNDCVYTTEKVDSRFEVQSGDLLIAMSGATTGKNGVFFSKTKAYLNQRVGNIKIKHPNILLPKFRNYYIMNMRDEILKGAYGGAQPNISSVKIGNMFFPLPALREQERIVDCIESLFAQLDKAKEKAQSVVDGFENRKSAILYKAFSGELTAKWRREFGIDIAKWDKFQLKEVCIVNPSKAYTNDLPDELDVSFFPMPSLSEVVGEITDPKVKKLGEVRKGFTYFSEGDVVFAKITPCMENGKSAVIGPLVNKIGFGTTEFYVLRCGDKLFNRYLYHIVRWKKFRDEAKAVMTGAVGQQRVPRSFIEEYPLILPSYAEQMQIVEIVDRLFSEEFCAKEAAEAVISQIDTIKKSILARAFRGELGTNDPNEESAVEQLKQILEEEVPAEPKKRSKSVPKELKAKLETELERKIIKLYFGQETESLPAEEIMSVSSKKFEIMEALHNLEQRGIVKKLNNGNYRLMG